MEPAGFFQTIITWLTSDTAILIYIWMGLLTLFLVSIWIAYRFTGIVREIDAAAIFSDQNIPEYKIRQPIKNRLIKLERQAKSGYVTVLTRSSAMMFFGIVVPGLLLGLIVHYQDRLLPGPAILIAGGEVVPSSTVSYFQTIAFILDQALRGGLSDAMEVFDLKITPITNNPDQGIYTIMVFAYRFICGTVATAIVYVAIRVRSGRRSLIQAQTNLRDQLEAFDKRADDRAV
jgi:hypothetical protein